VTAEIKIFNGMQHVAISVIDVFDFQLFDDFRMAYLDTIGSGTSYIVDFCQDSQHR
jgi:hypothetical protein